MNADPAFVPLAVVEAMSEREAMLEDLLRQSADSIARSLVEKRALRARVAKLETALRDCKRYAEDHDDEWVSFRVDDALKDEP
jgi:hypothetical protein